MSYNIGWNAPAFSFSFRVFPMLFRFRETKIFLNLSPSELRYGP